MNVDDYPSNPHRKPAHTFFMPEVCHPTSRQRQASEISETSRGTSAIATAIASANQPKQADFPGVTTLGAGFDHTPPPRNVLPGEKGLLAHYWCLWQWG